MHVTLPTCHNIKDITNISHVQDTINISQGQGHYQYFANFKNAQMPQGQGHYNLPTSHKVKDMTNNISQD